MNARIVGSRFLDERRRKRLTSDSDSTEWALAASTPPSSARPSPSPGRGRWQSTSRLRFPLRKAISRRKWKVWSVGLLALAFAAGILAGGLTVIRQPQTLGPGFEQIFDLETGVLVRFYSTVQMLLTGQLAMFIGWARSRNPHDLGRRYRVWAWIAAICFGYSLFIGTDAQTAIVETIRWAGGIHSSLRLSLGWMVPTGICLLLCLLRLNSEIHDNRVSQALLWMALASWTVVGAWQLGGGGTFADTTAIGGDAVVLAACRMFGHWCLLMGLLWHARHVVYKSAGMPARAPSRLRRILSKLRAKRAPSTDGTAADRNARKSQPAAGKKARKSDVAAVNAGRSKESEAARADKPAPARSTTTSKSTSIESTPRPVEKPTAVSPSSPVARPAGQRSLTPTPASSTRPSPPFAKPAMAATKPAPTTAKPASMSAKPAPTLSQSTPGSTKAVQATRIDPSEDSLSDDASDGDLRGGLSKKERRKLRKQIRQQHEADH